MSLILPVLVRGINNLSDARYCAGMGADGLIFTLDPTVPGAVDAATVKELAGWVAGVELIGEFGDATGPDINRVVAECGLSSVLLRLDPSRRHLPEGLAVPAIVEVPAALITDQHYYTAAIADLTAALPQGFAFFTTVPAAADAAEHAYWLSLAQQGALWLAGPPAAAATRHLAEAVQPTGLIVAGGDEIKPGLRDFTELEAVFEALEEA